MEGFILLKTLQLHLFLKCALVLLFHLYFFHKLGTDAETFLLHINSEIKSCLCEKLSSCQHKLAFFPQPLNLK